MIYILKSNAYEHDRPRNDRVFYVDDMDYEFICHTNEPKELAAVARACGAKVKEVVIDTPSFENMMQADGLMRK